MIHEIYPDIYDPTYINIKAGENDIILCNRGNRILAYIEKGKVSFPTLSELSEITGCELSELKDNSWYLFSISKIRYFTTKASTDKIPEYDSMEKIVKDMPSAGKLFFFMNINRFREENEKLKVFTAATGMHMILWRDSKRFCGVCGTKTVYSESERAMVCPNCKTTEYPKISPAIIVAITNNDRLLLIRNKLGYYKKLALVSGYVEIGESFEETLTREVYEEVGLKVKNIKYYRNQPWGLSGAQMIGYTAELDGDDTIRMQESEISEAGWYKREDIPEYPHSLSVGNELINAFKNKLPPFNSAG
ncbi:MAG: NAD(+) diphosphatase [Lachnospiraceae bacterium]|nr:NAD(+) diphosphatase [Lachnospiraceae bacterium]